MTPQHAKPRSIPMLVLATVMLLIAPRVNAQSGSGDGVRVEAELSRSSVYVGDQLSYTVTVYGANDPSPPEIEFPDQVNALFHGRSTQSFTSMEYVNGRRNVVSRRSHLFQYTLTAESEGEIVIPAPVVIVDGKRVVGPETRFRALLPTRADDDELVATFERTRIYQNETIEGECVWWIGGRTSEFNFASSNIPESFEIRPVPVAGQPQYILDFPFAGQTITARLDTAMRDGQERSRFTFRFTLTPTQTGHFEFGPLRAIFSRQDSRGPRVRSYVDSNTVELEVIPVPEEGRPDGYEGAIGTFQLESQASVTRVNVGDPIGLTLRIRGKEPMTGVRSAPDLTQMPEFAEQFKIDSDGWREVAPRTDGLRVYETTIRALSDSVTEIPPIRLPSFNPTTGRYEIFASQAIPLDVTAVKEVTLADALISAPRETPSTPGPPPVEHIALSPAAPGLWAHVPIEEMRRNPGFDLAMALREPIWIGTLTLPPVLYASVLTVVGYRRRRDPVLHRLRRAYRAARARSGVDALRMYVSGVLDINPDAVVASDAMNLPVPESLRRKVYTLMLGAEGDHAETPARSDASSLLRDLHDRCVRSHREAHR